MFEQHRWSRWSVLTLIAGYVWCSAAASLGVLAALPLWILGAAFFGSGVSQLVWPGDTRINQTAAIAGAAAVVLSIPYGLVLGLSSLLVLGATGAGAVWAAGASALRLEPHYEDVPLPVSSPALVGKVAIDELVLGLEQWSTAGFPLDGMLERVIGELEEADALFAKEGFLEKPDRYHPLPPPLVDPEVRLETVGSHRVEVLRFESGYSPAEGRARARPAGSATTRAGTAGPGCCGIPDPSAPG